MNLFKPKFWDKNKISLFSILLYPIAILIKFLILILIGIFLSYSIPNILGNKIGGFNGDACGASVVLVETAILFMHAILL